MEVIVDKLDNRWNQGRKKISYKEISNFRKERMIGLNREIMNIEGTEDLIEPNVGNIGKLETIREIRNCKQQNQRMRKRN